MFDQDRVNSKHGGGGLQSSDQANLDRRERLRKLALETVDLNKDPSARPRAALAPHRVCCGAGVGALAPCTPCPSIRTSM